MTEARAFSAAISRFAKKRRRGLNRLQLAVLGHGKAITVFTAVAVVCVLLSYTLLVLFGNIEDPPWGKAAVQTGVAVLTSLSVTPIFYVLALVVNSVAGNDTREFEMLDAFPFDSFIPRSGAIEVCVHGWDGLFCGKDGKAEGKLQDSWTQTKRAKAWRKFFDQSPCNLDLILPYVNGLDWGSMGVPDESSKHDQALAESNLKAICARTGMTEEEQRREISETVRLAKELGNSRVSVSFTDHLRWTCTVLFDKRDLLLSLYSDKKGKNGERLFDAPAFLINVDQFHYVGGWIGEVHGGSQG